MIVVPTFTEGCEGKPGHVAAMIRRVVATVAECVAERIDRPDQVVAHDDAHESAPIRAVQQSAQFVLHGSPQCGWQCDTCNQCVRVDT